MASAAVSQLEQLFATLNVVNDQRMPERDANYNILNPQHSHSPVAYSGRSTVPVSASASGTMTMTMSAGPPLINGYAAEQKNTLNQDSFTERAVDVPNNFVAARKEPPKWPGRSAAGTPNGNKTPASATSSVASYRGPPDRSADDQLDGRVRFHEDELRKRRGDEARQERERAFLNDSLRGSAKLRALEIASRGKSPKVAQPEAAVVGVANAAYDMSEMHENAQNLVRERSSRRRKPAQEDEVDAQLATAFDSGAIDRLLQEIQSQLGTPDASSDLSLHDDLATVQLLLRSDSTKRLLATCDLISRAKRRVDSAPPQCTNAAAMAAELSEQLAAKAATPQHSQQAAALIQLLDSPVFVSLLQTHDKLANALRSDRSSFGLSFLESAASPAANARKSVGTPVKTVTIQDGPVEPRSARQPSLESKLVLESESQQLPESRLGAQNQAFAPDDEQEAITSPDGGAVVSLEDSGDIRVLKLARLPDELLGATIRNEPNGALIIGRILKGGLIERSGLLNEGDELLEVNSVDMRGRTVNDAYDIINKIQGTLTLIVAPNKDYVVPASRRTNFCVRALFEYNAADDPYVPCRELGMEFKRGDVLCVLNDDDPNWWQARLVQQNGRSVAGSEEQLPCLIPSPTFYRERERLRRQIARQTAETNNDTSLCSCFGGKKRRKTAMFAETAREDATEVLTYDEVGIYYPQPNRKRPIVLVGAEKVGRSDLRERLLKADPDRFAGAVPHTTRLPKDKELNGVDFNFVSRSEFERDATAGRFIEYGEFERNLYGTSIDSVKAVINNGKVCVLALHAESLHILNETDLKPFVVFIAPPDIERLRALRSRQNPGSRVSDDELKTVIEMSRSLDQQFGHFFDWALTFVDADQAYGELLAQINRLEVEPQYVPSRWLRSTSIYGTVRASTSQNALKANGSNTELENHYENVTVVAVPRNVHAHEESDS